MFRQALAVFLILSGTLFANAKVFKNDDSIFSSANFASSSPKRPRYTDESGGVYTLIEAKAGYFHPTCGNFRRIYSGGGIYGIEASCQAWKGLYPWISGSFFSQSGHSMGDRSRTIVTFVPIGYGLKYIFSCNRYLDVYAGAGGTITYLNMKDRSSYVTPSVSKWGSGGIVKAGFLVHPTNWLFFDLFSDYSFIKIAFRNDHHGNLMRHAVDLSGFSFGGGIGIRF